MDNELLADLYAVYSKKRKEMDDNLADRITAATSSRERIGIQLAAAGGGIKFSYQNSMTVELRLEGGGITITFEEPPAAEFPYPNLDRLVENKPPLWHIFAHREQDAVLYLDIEDIEGEVEVTELARGEMVEQIIRFVLEENVI